MEKTKDDVQKSATGILKVLLAAYRANIQRIKEQIDAIERKSSQNNKG